MFNNPYSPYAQTPQMPVGLFGQQGMMSQPIPAQSVVRVNGENGAKAYQMSPNSSALLLDETSPIVWLVQTDGAGYKTVSPYTITPCQQEPLVDTKSLEARIARLEAIMDGKPDSTSPKRKSGNGGGISEG